MQTPLCVCYPIAFIALKPCYMNTSGLNTSCLLPIYVRNNSVAHVTPRLIMLTELIHSLLKFDHATFFRVHKAWVVEGE